MRTHDPFQYYRRLARLKTHVQEHVGQRLSTSDAAEIVGVAPTYFSSWFSALVGTPYTEWLAEYRLRRAEQLLAARNYDLLEVASICGFGTSRTFERVCRKYRDCTPRELKEHAMTHDARSRDPS